MDRIVSHPGTGAVGGLAFDGDSDADGSLASSLDPGSCRLHEDRKICLEQVRAIVREPPETVQGGVHLLVVVEHPGDIETGLIEFAGKLQCDCHPALHVHGAPAVDHNPFRSFLHRARKVSGHWNGVKMTGHHHSLPTTEPGPGHHTVTVAHHLEMRLSAKQLFYQVRKLLLVPGNALDVNDGT